MRPADPDGLIDAAPATLPQKAARLMADAAGVGLALADAEDLRVLTTNRRLREWFGADCARARLDTLFPPAEVAAVATAVEDHRFEMEIAVRRRPVRLAVRIARETASDGRAVLVAEAQNVSKIAEIEHMLRTYSSMVERQNRDLTAARDRVERLLLNIMPKTVYEEWRRFGVTAPRLYPQATILMLDFVGFTEMAVTADPPALIAELNDIFTGFDRIVEQFGCERLKTIGDAYMAVSGLPLENPDHAANVAGVALRIRRYLAERNAVRPNLWRCRMGLASGPVIGSIVGVQKYVYDVFGPPVNAAARLEALAAPMEILLSEETRRALGPEFRVAPLGARTLRGIGRVEVHRLEGGDQIDD